MGECQEGLTLHLGQAGAVAEDEDDPDEVLVGPDLGLGLQLLQQAWLLLRQAAQEGTRVSDWPDDLIRENRGLYLSKGPVEGSFRVTPWCGQGHQRSKCFQLRAQSRVVLRVLGCWHCFTVGRHQHQPLYLDV